MRWSPLHVTVAGVDGQPEDRDTVASTAAPATAAHQAELSDAGQYLTRLLSLATAAALGLLTYVGWLVNDAGDNFGTTGLTMPMLLVGVFWLATFATSMWMVRLEWSGISLALVGAALGILGYGLGRAIPPNSAAAPTYFGLGAGELAVELQFSLICAALVFVAWAVWATMPVARRSWPRLGIAILGVGIVVLLVVAWRAVPSYPSYID